LRKCWHKLDLEKDYLLNKYMAKSRRTQSTSVKTVKTTPSQNHHLLVILIIVLLLGLAFVSMKYFLAKKSWMKYGIQAQDQILNAPTRDSARDASVIAATMLKFPEGTPMFMQPAVLAQYVEVISQQTGRDLVVVDVNGKILADTVVENVGQVWAEDKAGEVMLTIQDGKPREFEEVSVDYPNGLTQTVVPVRDDSGKIYGAVIFSAENRPE